LKCKTILITGGLGYLGSRIAQSLLKRSEYKIILGTRNSQSELPKKLFGCQLVLFDLLQQNNIKKNLKDVDIIIHLAAMNANECDKNPNDALLVNGLGTLNLVNSARASNVKKIIYFSTAHVYGSPLLGNITEETLTVPKNHYAISHRVAEDYIIEASKEGKISTAILRLTNAIGNPVHRKTNCWMLVANDFAKQIIEKNEIIIRSSGNQSRDFIPISDVSSALFLLLNKNTFGEVLNLGSGVSLTILDLAKLFSLRAKAILDIDVSIFKENNNNSPNNSFNFKIDRILSLGYSPKNLIEDEIDNLLRFVNQEFKLKTQH
jgi:UDP-glucose 4-epimerase